MFKIQAPPVTVPIWVLVSPFACKKMAINAQIAQLAQLAAQNAICTKLS